MQVLSDYIVTMAIRVGPVDKGVGYASDTVTVSDSILDSNLKLIP